MSKEYRIKSAEALGLLVIEIDGAIITVQINGIRVIWNPIEDANQMLMVWDWLIKTGCLIQAEGDRKDWEILFFFTADSPCFRANNKDIKLATAEAFMEYSNNK